MATELTTRIKISQLVNKCVRIACSQLLTSLEQATCILTSNSYGEANTVDSHQVVGQHV